MILNNHSLYTFCEKLALKILFALGVGSALLRNTGFFSLPEKNLLNFSFETGVEKKRITHCCLIVVTLKQEHN